MACFIVLRIYFVLQLWIWELFFFMTYGEHVNCSRQQFVNHKEAKFFHVDALSNSQQVEV